LPGKLHTATKKEINQTHFTHDKKKLKKLTAASRQVFSLRAPTQPVKPMMKVMAPATMRINAGSKATLVNLLKLLNVSFSVHAHIPTAVIPSPVSCTQLYS
jgi:hypothetical protein